ncbi:uncharacterized protein EV422DRAFT_38416 [Fimicolochytrium jonesii]|uniref:uncharacterized protein n=1 Tax=Fimicolochytrium jonesii TaxID=1396493 RepID=UPI0022FE20AF|nr:uncharacterized protein EV422DRAFT_38416 [Fimicolochytrium jonesii]KAI8821331.1 hypothetical protein EV422DRAFT_38416 [Fimicolochytrium jonesii]
MSVLGQYPQPQPQQAIWLPPPPYPSVPYNGYAQPGYISNGLSTQPQWAMQPQQQPVLLTLPPELLRGQQPSQFYQQLAGLQAAAPVGLEGVPAVYITEKLRSMGRTYWGDTDTSDCWLYVHPPAGADSATDGSPAGGGASNAGAGSGKSTSVGGSANGDASSKRPPTDPRLPTNTASIPSAVTIIPAHSVYLSNLSPTFRKLIEEAQQGRQGPSNSMAPGAPVPGNSSAFAISIRPPCPDAFPTLLYWLYTADTGVMHQFLRTFEGAVPAVMANAEWLSLDDRELLILCNGVAEEIANESEGDETDDDSDAG